MARRDPKVRADGMCAQCRKPRRSDVSAQVLLDPFCTSVCCRVWHECALPESEHAKGRRENAKAKAAA